MRATRLALLTAGLALAGCAYGSHQEDDLLVDAGFTKVKADTPQWLATMKSLPPHRFAHRTVNGTPMIFWSDPVACRCVYTGTPQAFAAYRQLHGEEVTAFDESTSGPGILAQ